MSVSELVAHTGYWMRMVSNAVSHEFARKIATKDVTVAEWAFLRTLYDVDAMAPSDLSANMGMTRGAISKLSDRLLAKKLIGRTESTEDKRTHTLSLTEEGRGMVPMLAALADKNDTEFFGVLTEEDQQTLDRILKVLAERSKLDSTPVD
ncbi:MarR family transcriptional regulator [Hoeflea sp. 108]|uniref:MarR family transcriptional regulator n=1 Tax=Hoeflea sp. 108 TaxID=1116369 RepID=UPI0005908311